MFTKRCLVVVTVLTLFILLIPACSGGDNKANSTFTAAPTTNATPTFASTNSSTPMPMETGKPVKIGAINSWSGAAAMSGVAYADPIIKLMEKQVADIGGILGGRELKVVKYDNRASVSDASAGAKKLVLEDKVSVLTLGGYSGPEFIAVADAAQELRVPFVCYAGFDGLEERTFSVVSAQTPRSLTEDTSRMLIDVFGAKEVGFIQMQSTAGIERSREQSKAIEAFGGKTVFMQDVPPGTQDFMPYLTKIKYAEPDVLVLNLISEDYITVAKQIMELGGWGKTKVLATSSGISAAKLPGAEGWIIVTAWSPGKDYPASFKFEQDYQTVNGKPPTSNHMYFYLCFLTAVEAIKFAGSDNPIKIAEVLRSGNLQFDTPAGMAHYNTKGESGLPNMFVQVQNGGTFVEFK